MFIIYGKKKEKLAAVPHGSEPGSDRSVQGADGGLRSSFQRGSHARGLTLPGT